MAVELASRKAAVDGAVQSKLDEEAAAKGMVAPQHDGLINQLQARRVSQQAAAKSAGQILFQKRRQRQMVARRETDAAQMKLQVSRRQADAAAATAAALREHMLALQIEERARQQQAAAKALEEAKQQAAAEQQRRAVEQELAAAQRAQQEAAEQQQQAAAAVLAAASRASSRWEHLYEQEVCRVQHIENLLLEQAFEDYFQQIGAKPAVCMRVLRGVVGGGKLRKPTSAEEKQPSAEEEKFSEPSEPVPTAMHKTYTASAPFVRSQLRQGCHSAWGMRGCPVDMGRQVGWQNLHSQDGLQQWLQQSAAPQQPIETSDDLSLKLGAALHTRLEHLSLPNYAQFTRNVAVNAPQEPF